MNRELVAIRDGKYSEAIELARANIESHPEDIGSQFTLAQAYESTGATEAALFHAGICIDALPDSFEALTLAARCASKIEKYDDAYKYAKKALMDDQNPNFSNIVQIIFRILSYIPGLKSLRSVNKSVVSSYSTQTEWLHKYVVWYEQKSPNQ